MLIVLFDDINVFVYVMLCSDGSRSDGEKAVAGLEVSGNGKPSFSKATVILPSRTVLPTFARTPPPSSLVIGMPRFDQKLDELTAERKAARCAAEAMANLSVLPVAAMSVPPSVSSTVDSLQSVAAASTAEVEHRGSPLATIASRSTAMPMDVEPSDANDASLPLAQTDKYSGYDRHFKKKFFGSERRPPSSEPVARVGDPDHPAGDGGRDGNVSSPDVSSSVACKKARLAEPGRGAVSPLCVSAQGPTSAVTELLPSTPTTSAVTASQPSFVRLSGDDTSRGSPSRMSTPTPVSSTAAADSEAACSTPCTGKPSSCADSGLVVTLSTADVGSSQPSVCPSGQTVDEQAARTETSSP